MTIAETLVAKAPPIYEDSDGTLRIGGTRVTLDSLLGAYLAGQSAPQIAEIFPVLNLCDIHAVLSYYHANQELVDSYLAEGERVAEDARRQNAKYTNSDYESLHEELVLRHNQASRGD